MTTRKKTRTGGKGKGKGKNVPKPPDGAKPPDEPDVTAFIEEEEEESIINKGPKNTIRIVSRVYPTSYPNSKNVKIGQYKVIIDSDQFPVGHLDEVNYLVGQLANYSNFMGNQKNQYTNESDIKNRTNSFFKNDKQEWSMIPITYKPISEEDNLDSRSSIIIKGEDKDKKIKELEEKLKAFQPKKGGSRKSKTRKRGKP